MSLHAACVIRGMSLEVCARRVETEDLILSGRRRIPLLSPCCPPLLPTGVHPGETGVILSAAKDLNLCFLPRNRPIHDACFAALGSTRVRAWQTTR
jgi:hypothetical protein